MERPYLKLWERYLNEQSAWNQSTPAPAPATAPAATTPAPATSQPATPEPAATTSKPIVWKELAKQGYEQTPGSRPLERSATLHDANIVAMGSNVTAADMAVQQQLRSKKIFDWSRQGLIVHRTTSDGKIESKYLSNAPM